MSRRPEARQRSVLEFIRELQSVEAELGFAQTPLEVSMDGWAVAALADPDDKTRIVSVNSIDPQGQRRRRRQPATGNDPSATQPPHSHSAPGNSLTRVRRRGRRTGTLWALVAAAALIVGLAATAATLIVRQAGTSIPTVSDVSGRLEQGTVVFTWADPGARQDDNFVVKLRTGETSIQRGTEFSVDPKGQTGVCVTVTVNREGKNGAPSGEKCVDVDGGGQ